jgi:hypothetical protein
MILNLDLKLSSAFNLLSLALLILIWGLEVNVEIEKLNDKSDLENSQISKVQNSSLFNFS